MWYEYCKLYTPTLKKRVYTVLPLSVHPLVHPSIHQIFLKNYYIRISEIWFQGLYKSVMVCDVFSNSSLNNFLFTKIFRPGYHKWAVAQSFTCSVFAHTVMIKLWCNTWILCFFLGPAVWKAFLKHALLTFNHRNV